MSDATGADESGAGTGRSGDGATSGRRDFLKVAVGASVVAGAVGSTLVGTVGAAGIPTPWLERDGNLVRDQRGNKVVLRGVNVIDPARAVETDWRRPLSETIEHATDQNREWFSRVVRIPIQPGDVTEDGQGYGSEPAPGSFTRDTLEAYLATYLDPVIDRCDQIGVYAIVDYHRHRDHELEFTNQALHEEVSMFWDTVAPRYADRSHVLFEVYNEPISPYIGFRQRDVNVDITDPEAEATWLTWREAAQPWVDTIRSHAPRNLVLIGSPSWSQWTYWADKNEFAGDNLAYTGHVYAHPNLRPLGEYFGTPSRSVPVFMTEIGWAPDGNEYLQGTVSTEGQQFVDFFEEYDSVHWTVWCFDHIWEPAMFEQDDQSKEWHLLEGESHHGTFFRDYLSLKRDEDLPAGEGGESATHGSSGTTTPERAPVDGSVPRDLDGDGLYMDINANGRLDNDDMVTYFEEMTGTAIQDDVGAYDYNVNGRIDFDDVVTLFSTL